VMKAGAVVASGPCKPGVGGAAATAEIQALLAAQPADVTTGLALAALMAGLAPVGGAHISPVPSRSR
jgi:hypothetical protein